MCIFSAITEIMQILHKIKKLMGDNHYALMSQKHWAFLPKVLNLFSARNSSDLLSNRLEIQFEGALWYLAPRCKQLFRVDLLGFSLSSVIDTLLS